MSIIGWYTSLLPVGVILFYNIGLVDTTFLQRAARLLRCRFRKCQSYCQIIHQLVLFYFTTLGWSIQRFCKELQGCWDADFVNAKVIARLFISKYSAYTVHLHTYKRVLATVTHQQHTSSCAFIYATKIPLHVYWLVCIFCIFFWISSHFAGECSTREKEMMPAQIHM